MIKAVIGVVISAPRPLDAIKTVIIIIAVMIKLKNIADWDTLIPNADATWPNQSSQIIPLYNFKKGYFRFVLDELKAP